MIRYGVICTKIKILRSTVYQQDFTHVTKSLTYSAGCVKSPSNVSLAHCSVCSMALGKFLRVQMGTSFSGGS